MPHARQGTVLLFVLGLITVMLVTAFGFLRNMQMACGTQQSQRRSELARQAAEMGMQHAIAVCLHEYAMSKEVKDDILVSGATVATRLDGPHRNVFNIVSPATTTTSSPGSWKQTPQPYDMPAGLPFNNLLTEWKWGGYNKTENVYGVAGFGNGVTMRPGYARWFEANRWNYAPDVAYDPATYDNLDFRPSRAPTFLKAPLLVGSGVSTPFPVVDPYEAGLAHLRSAGDPLHNPLDNPLFLDADCRPVDDASKARYRMRYAVSTTDMSGALWANTDMPWLDDALDWVGGAAAKRLNRRQYRESVESVGGRLGRDLALQSVYLGYGPISNNQFFQNGIPHDWMTRNPNGFSGPDQANQPMGFRLDNLSFGDRRYLHQVLGSPFMNAFDPTRADGTKQWLGSAIPSFTDLGFALSHRTSDWEYRASHGNDGPQANKLGKSDLIAQHMSTPFGKPYDIDGHPWAVNVLTAPALLLSAMVKAYMPPESRRMRVDKETQDPRWRYTQGGTVYEGWGNKDYIHANPDPNADYWRSNSWTIPLKENLTIPGLGIDVFTDAFQPHGITPFNYPTPPHRNYFGSSEANRPFPTVGIQDERSKADRYPGEAFFCNPSTEPQANKMTRWLSLSANPVQVADDLAPAYPVRPDPVDYLARHIVFYVGTPNPVSHPNHRYITANIQMYLDGRNNISDFDAGSPISGSGISLYDAGGSYVVYSGDGNPTPIMLTQNKTLPVPAGVSTYRPIHDPEDFSIPPALRTMEPEKVTAVTKPETWRITRSSSNGISTAGNSYWNRLGLAFLHAVAVTQTANLAWADPQDARSRLPGTDLPIGSSSNLEPNNNPTSPVGPTVYPLPPPLNSTWNGTRFSGTPGRSGAITYNTDPTDMSRAGLTRKGPGSWDPKASDFDSLEKVDRQFLANLGESFDLPGTRTPLEVRTTERPPRYLRNQTQGSGAYPGTTTFHVRLRTAVAEYWVSNNLRTLLTPIDTSSGAGLTPRSTDSQTGRTPRGLWLLDEWNGGTPPSYAPEAGYTPGTTTGPSPTRLARARAKLMERMLNDWRMSFLGSSKSYSAFRPKDFDGDGLVFCSGYASGAAVDPDTGLTCFEAVSAGGHDGPGAPMLTIFSVTGCLTFTRSHQYKIHVRGELVDNALNLPVSEHFLESTLLIDPDNNIVRPVGAWSPPSGLEDSTLIMQHPIHNFYRGFMTRSYP